MTVKISPRGQLVIPASIRKKYDLKANCNVELLDMGDEIVIIPVSGKTINNSRGILKGISSKDLIEQRIAEKSIENSKYD